MTNTRAGTFIHQPEGFNSFVPKPLPPDPPIKYDEELHTLLSSADRALGRLDGITQILPNPDLFVAMYVQKEAVLSSQIEGTQASLSDVLLKSSSSEKKEDISEVVNYVHAMKYGLNRLEKFPLSLRLIREIHYILLSSGRGSSRNPGEFRKTQNWIGPAGCTLETATFVPPVIPDMEKALNELELFFYDKNHLPPLIQIALIHAQFESIHPFLDGNGRMGRLLITFWLCQQEILSKPLLYLSYYFKQNRIEYYDRLMDVRLEGNWEVWIKYFLRGVSVTSDEAVNTAKSILSEKDLSEKKLRSYSNNHLRLLDLLFEDPVITKKRAADYLNVSFPTAVKLISDLCNEKILEDSTPNQSRNKQYIYSNYLNILNRGTEV